MARIAVVTLSLWLAGCAQGSRAVDTGSDAGPGLDAAPPTDAGPGDTGPTPTDAGPGDTGPAPADSGSADPDAGGSDAGPGDAGGEDAGSMCTGPLDCDDGDECTIDSCESTGCVHEPESVTGSDCTDAIDVSGGGTFSGDSTCAGDDHSGGCGAADAPDVHFELVLTEMADVTIDASGTSFDSVLTLGTSCTGGELGCDDDTAGSGAARLERTGLAAGTYYVALDGKAGGDGGAWSLDVTVETGPSMETVSFPSSSDTAFPSDGQLWVLGDYVEGSRTTSLPNATSVSMTVQIPTNGLTCDTQDMRMMINGTEVGRFSISPGVASVSDSFTFPEISGTTYVLRYENVRTVAAGCGAAQVGPGGTVTLQR